MNYFESFVKTNIEVATCFLGFGLLKKFVTCPIFCKNQRMRANINILILVWPLFVMAQCVQEKPVQIIKTGTWRGSHVNIDVSLDWYGLFSYEDGLRLEKVQVKVEEVSDPFVEALGEKVAKKVSIQRSEKPIFLVAGNRFLKAGPVTGKYYSYNVLVPEQNVDILFKDKEKYQLSPYGSEFPNLSDDEHAADQYGIWLRGGGKEQLIVEDKYFFGTGPRLVWSGDLDGDDRLDLLLDCICEDEASTMDLYLSSRAGENELLSMVAVWDSGEEF